MSTDGHVPSEEPENGTHRLSKDVLRAWWLERYSIEEIIELAACLDGFGI